MRACLTGRHSFGYFSIAVDRKVTCCRSTTDAFDFDFLKTVGMGMPIYFSPAGATTGNVSTEQLIYTLLEDK